jgi:ribosome biogenesis ATPase
MLLGVMLVSALHVTVHLVAQCVPLRSVGALVEVRSEVKHNLLDPIADPDLYEQFGLSVPAGLMFFGPPGCGQYFETMLVCQYLTRRNGVGKTLLAKAVANESGANFISVKGPELLNMYVGKDDIMTSSRLHIHL